MNDSELENQHVTREPIEPMKEEPVAKLSARPSSSRRPRSAGKNPRINTPHSRPTPRLRDDEDDFQSAYSTSPRGGRLGHRPDAAQQHVTPYVQEREAASVWRRRWCSPR